MASKTDHKTRARKVGRVIKNILLGRNTFGFFLRIYLLVVILGAVFLYVGWSHSGWEITYPDNHAADHKYTFWDALFVACSAFSNTGLTSVVVGDFYNFFGQFVVFTLIGLGGVGIISLVFVVWNLFKKEDDVRLNQLVLIQSERGASKFSNSFRSVRFCVIFIIVVEIFFGFLYSFWLCFYPNYNIDPNSYASGLTWVDPSSTISAYHNYGKSFWQGIFLSVSAMNNAGFDAFTGNASLASFRNDWNILLQLGTMIEILLGGIGYPLIFDIYEKQRYKKHNLKYQYSLFTKIALIAYFAVFVAGLGVSFGFEYGQRSSATILGTSNLNGEWGKCEGLNKNWAIIYETFVTRSAGFSTFNQNLLVTGDQLNLSILMFIGSSPSSTGGGIRTTTVAIIVLSIWHLVRRHENVTIFHRTIPEKTVVNSYIVFVVGLILVLAVATGVYYCPTTIAGTSSIANISNMTWMKSLFEISSAIGTVGLSMGISQCIKPIGLFLMVLIMFIGQLGITTTLLSWFKKGKKTRDVQYSMEDVKIG